MRLANGYMYFTNWNSFLKSSWKTKSSSKIKKKNDNVKFATAERAFFLIQITRKVVFSYSSAKHNHGLLSLWRKHVCCNPDFFRLVFVPVSLQRSSHSQLYMKRKSQKIMAQLLHNSIPIKQFCKIKISHRWYSCNS